MKVLVLLVAISCAAANDEEVQSTTAYRYISRIAIPLANQIYEKEMKFKDRIVGGSLSHEGQFPYQVGILSKYHNMNETGICGGSLISPNRVMTAAHCWYDGEHQAYVTTVVLGSILLYSGGTRIKSSEVVVHPEWDPKEIRNDIAIIYLPDAVTFSDTISPVSLPSGSELEEDFSGERAFASGFGKTGTFNDVSNQSLSDVELRIIKNWYCKIAFPKSVHESNICTSGLLGRGICDGDSGGPLVVMRDEKPIVVGITSFGFCVCESRLPSVYTRVTSFIDFINENL